LYMNTPPTIIRATTQTPTIISVWSPGGGEGIMIPGPLSESGAAAGVYAGLFGITAA